MSEFSTWWAYAHFAFAVKQRERYFRSPEMDEFLRLVLETSANRQATIPAGRIFFRAQLGNGWRTVGAGDEEFDDVAPHEPERMRPRPNAATEGRVNPKGIPCLYLATDANTAMAEVRPWLGMFVSVAQFKTVRDLRIINCSAEHSQDYTFYPEEPPPPERERAVWRDIDRSFSEPVHADEISANYVPTQILAEYFKRNGFDGVVYKSLLGDGYSVALFDLAAADQINCQLHTARRLSFTFEEVTNPYFIRKHYPELEPKE
jgi:hypothetical protein